MQNIRGWNLVIPNSQQMLGSNLLALWMLLVWGEFVSIFAGAHLYGSSLPEQHKRHVHGTETFR